MEQPVIPVSVSDSQARFSVHKCSAVRVIIDVKCSADRYIHVALQLCTCCFLESKDITLST